MASENPPENPPKNPPENPPENPPKDPPKEPPRPKNWYDLPLDIQDRIWDFAADARPSEPGVQMFHISMFDGTPEAQAPENHDAVVLSSTRSPAAVQIRTGIHPDSSVILGVPHRMPLYYLDRLPGAREEVCGDRHWANAYDEEHQEQYDHAQAQGGIENPSIYLIDGALWSVCKRSRLAMEKKFQSGHYKHVVKQLGGASLSHHDFLKMPATGYYIPGSRNPVPTPADAETQHSKRARMRARWTKVKNRFDKATVPAPETLAADRVEARYFTVFPQRDLFIFPLCDVPRSWFTLSSILTLNPASGDKSWGHSFGFRNIGIVWNPTWDYEYHLKTQTVLSETESNTLVGEQVVAENQTVAPLSEFFRNLILLLKVPPTQAQHNIWLIDHRIRPKELSLGDMRRYKTALWKEKKIKDMKVVFRASDRKYTAVEFSQDRTVPIPWETGAPVDPDSSLLTADTMRRWIRGKQDQENAAAEAAGTDVELLDIYPHVGLLACEFL